MRAEGLEQAGSAVRAGTAADADDDWLGTGVQREPDQLAGAARGGVERIEPGSTQEPQTRRFGKLDDQRRWRRAASRAALDTARIGSVNWRTVDTGARVRCEEHVEGAVTAVGDRHHDR